MATKHQQQSREHLLSARSSLAGQSRPASVHSMGSIDTVVAHGGNEPGSYRGFRSREAFLAALDEFAESKMYLENDYQIQGFYGRKTMDYYKNKPGLRDKSRRKTSAGITQSPRSLSQYASITEESLDQMPTAEGASAKNKNVHSSSEKPKESRTRRLSKVFTGGRRSTIA